MTELSIRTLKFWHPEVRITLLTDSISYQHIENEISSGVLKNCRFDDIAIVKGPSEVGLVRSRYLKTTMRTAVKGDFLYLDCDTIVCGRIQLPFLGNVDFAAVSNLHRPNGEPLAFDSRMTDQCGWPRLRHTYNSGVMFWRDSDEALSLAREYFEQWCVFKKETGRHNDQQALNHSIERCKAKTLELSSRFNAQIDVSPRHAFGASIWHVFASNHDRPVMKTVFDDYWAGRSTRFDFENVFERGHPWMVCNAMDRYIVRTFRSLAGELPLNDWRRSYLSGRHKEAFRNGFRGLFKTRKSEFLE